MPEDDGPRERFLADASDAIFTEEDLSAEGEVPPALQAYYDEVEEEEAEEINVEDILETDLKSWVPYFGPAGGQGWYNPETDEVRYQEEAPGGEDEAPAEDFFRNFPCIAEHPDVDPFEFINQHAEENPVDVGRAKNVYGRWHRNPLRASYLWAYGRHESRNPDIPDEVSLPDGFPEQLHEDLQDAKMQSRGMIRRIDPTHDEIHDTLLVYRGVQGEEWSELREVMEEDAVELRAPDIPDEAVQSWTPDPLIAALYAQPGGLILAARLPVLDLTGVSFFTDPERYDQAVEYIYAMPPNPQVEEVAAIHPKHGEDLGENIRAIWEEHFEVGFCEKSLDLVPHESGGWYDWTNDEVMSKEEVEEWVVRHTKAPGEPPKVPDPSPPETPAEGTGPLCCSCGNCFDSPKELGGHVAQTGHALSPAVQQQMQEGDDDGQP